MNRAFRLAGLLNLRKMQEEQAAGRLAVANAELQRADREVAQAQARLATIGRAGGVLVGADAADGGPGGQAGPAQASSMGATSNDLAMMAAVRDGARLDLQIKQSQREKRLAQAEERRQEWGEHKRASATLEKLEGRHNEAVIKWELHTEQVFLDEIASQRTTGGKKRGGGVDL